VAAVTPETAPEKTRIHLGLRRGAPDAPPPTPYAGAAGGGAQFLMRGRIHPCSGASLSTISGDAGSHEHV